jgi:hypothetical protein
MLDARSLPLRIVQRLFPADQVEAVREALDSTTVGAPAGDRDRIQVAVLKLYCEDPHRNLNVWVKAANVDYRDVLLWAETPSLARQRIRLELTPEELKALRAQDKAQLDAWLRSVA